MNRQRFASVWDAIDALMNRATAAGRRIEMKVLEVT
jgi:hypothetical protein